MNHVFALVDCNNFFVSCERVFAPILEKKALVVLSNNDGCAISRSDEAKALGIKMGEPFFKFKKLYEQGKVEVLSSNFELYRDISRRVMLSLKILCETIEIYSIDEAFLDFSKTSPEQQLALSLEIKNKIKQWTGIPVSIGIASTKTLAKLASHIAKKQDGIFTLMNKANIDDILNNIPIEEVWGIGRKMAPKLRLLGIGTAKDLKYSNPQLIRSKFTLMGERVIHELMGISCFKLDNSHQEKKSQTYSRTFSQTIESYDELVEVLICYISRACDHLRKEKLRAQIIDIQISTNRFSKKDKYYANNCTINLLNPSDNPLDIIGPAKKALSTIFKEGFKYNKLAIVMLDLSSQEQEQFNLFKKNNYHKSDKLMEAMDNINKSIGEETIFFAGEGIKQTWKTKNKNCSPRYTSNFSELPIVK